MVRVVACLLLVAFGFPALAQDAADVVVRLNRLENQVRQLSGQIEQLQFENRTLKEQVRKFQEDVEFRFQEGRGGARPAAPSVTPNQAPGPATPARPATSPSQPQRRSDVFDPSAAPDAPGAPRPLGTTPPSAPLASAGPGPGPGAPMPLPGAALSGIGDLIEDEPDDRSGDGLPPLDLNGTARTPASPPRSGPSIAAVTTADPRAEYEAAYAYLIQRQFEEAEMGFRRFIQSHPRDRLVPDAMYWLGESYLQRNRAREAAEQFLNVSTEHPKAAKAPDALLKLGVSLNALGAQDRACAVFAELDRKYPQAAPQLRQSSDRERKKAKCA
jgi:tol-pal system protein YbgF